MISAGVGVAIGYVILIVHRLLKERYDLNKLRNEVRDARK